MGRRCWPSYDTPRPPCYHVKHVRLTWAVAWIDPIHEGMLMLRTTREQAVPLLAHEYA
jgi:hypothetical protein